MRFTRLPGALAVLGLLWLSASAAPATALAAARPATLVPAGAHLVASGHIRPGERTTTTARFAIPARVCAKLSATHPQLDGRPCYGTETITFDSKLTRPRGHRAPGMAAASTVNVYNEYVCGPAQIWCFGVSAGWSVNYGVDAWTNWVDCSNWWVLGGSGGVSWCGSTGNYTFDSTAGENFSVSQAGQSFGGGQRLVMNAYGNWYEYNWS